MATTNTTFHATALQLVAQCGHPITVHTTVGAGEFGQFSLMATDPDGNQFYYEHHKTEQAALVDFAAAVGVTYRPVPVAYATTAQKEELIRLCNHTTVTAAEKTRILLPLNRYTEAELTEKLPQLREALKKRVAKQEAARLAAYENQRTGLAHLQKAA